LLEKFALLLGLNRSAARSMQLEFSENILAHELQLEPVGLCDESLCCVLGADGSVLNVVVLKANLVDIFAVVRQNHVAEVRLVCQYAPERVNDKDSDGATALHFAARYNSLEMAQLLLGARASADAKDKNGETALHYAACSNTLEVAELLLGAGASVDAKSKIDGRTPLHKAASYNNSLEVAELLLGARASTDATDKNGRTPLYMPRTHNHQQMVALLRRQ